MSSDLYELPDDGDLRDEHLVPDAELSEILDESVAELYRYHRQRAAEDGASFDPSYHGLTHEAESDVRDYLRARAARPYIAAATQIVEELWEEQLAVRAVEALLGLHPSWRAQQENGSA